MKKVAMMTTYHIHCGAVVRISPGVPVVPGSNPEWNFFLLFFIIRPIIITLIFYFCSGWSLSVAVPGICKDYGSDLWTILFCLVCWLTCNYITH